MHTVWQDSNFQSPYVDMVIHLLTLQIMFMVLLGTMSAVAILTKSQTSLPNTFYQSGPVLT